MTKQNFLVGEVDGETELEAARIYGVMGHGEIGFGEPALVEMAPQHIEANFVKTEGGVKIAEGEIADK